MALALAINALLVLVVVAAMAHLSVLLGAKSLATGDRNMPYETGMPPMEPAFRPVSVTYVRFALLFVVFDVELAFLLPAVCLPELTGAVVTAITVFMGMLGLMLAYVWRKGILECN